MSNLVTFLSLYFAPTMSCGITQPARTYEPLLTSFTAYSPYSYGPSMDTKDKGLQAILPLVLYLQKDSDRHMVSHVLPCLSGQPLCSCSFLGPHVQVKNEDLKDKKCFPYHVFRVLGIASLSILQRLEDHSFCCWLKLAKKSQATLPSLMVFFPDSH